MDGLRRVLILLASARLFHVAGALRANKDQGLSRFAPAVNSANGARNAVADGVTSENAFNLAEIIKQVLQPTPPARSAVSKNPSDLGNAIQHVLKPKAPVDGGASNDPFNLVNAIQQALKPKPPVVSTAAKNPFDLGNAVASIVQQALRPKAAAMTSSPASNKGLDRFVGWLMDQQKKAADVSTTSANQAAKETAQSAFNDFLKSAWSQAWKAVKQASEQDGQKHHSQVKPAETKHSEAMHADVGMNEAKQKLADAWKSLMDNAKGAATRAAEVDAHKLVEKATHMQETAKVVSKAAVDSSVAQAEHHIWAVDSADEATRMTAQKAAQQASQKALRDLLEWSQADDNAIVEVAEGKDTAPQKALKDLLEWSQADGNAIVEVSEGKDTAPQKALKDLLEWSQADDNTIAKAAEGKDSATASHPVFNPWADVMAAENQARAADWVAKSVERITATADEIFMKGHNKSEALSKSGKPGATKVAMEMAKEVIRQANLQTSRSAYLSKIARYARILLAKAVKAAMKTTNMQDFRKAWEAVLHIYSASGKVTDDAHRSLASSRDAMGAVALAMAEVGTHAVGEVLQAEVVLIAQVVGKVIHTDRMNMLGAWLQGLGQVKPVAEAAWRKGFSQGLQTMAQNDPHHVVGKVQSAMKHTASTGAAWVRTIAEILNSKEARAAVDKAAASATRAASAAAAAMTSHTADSLSSAAAEMAKKGQLPFLPHGSHFTASGNWNPDDGYKSKFVGNYMGSDFRSSINVKPNATHDRVVFAGHLTGPNDRKLEATSVSIKGNSPTRSSEAKWAIQQSGAKKPAAGSTVTFRADPMVGQDVHLNSTILGWTGENYGAGAVDAVAAPDGRAMGKFAGRVKTSAMKKPLEFENSFLQAKNNKR